MTHRFGQEHDPQDWNAAEWILFTSPLGLGHIAQKLLLGKWGSPKTPIEFYTYLAFAYAQIFAYSAVGLASIANPRFPGATIGHVRHVAAGQVLKAISPKPPIAAPMLLYPNLVMLAGMFGPRAMGSTRLD